MVVSLGSILLRTEPRREDTRDVASMHVAGATSEDILREMMDQAYDKFNLNITDIQILLAKSTDQWQDALTQGKITKLHLLEPTSLQVKAALCVVDDDPRLPKTRIHGRTINLYHLFPMYRPQLIFFFFGLRSYKNSQNPKHRCICDGTKSFGCFIIGHEYSIARK